MRKADEVAVECAARRHRGCSHGQCGRREAIVLRPDNSRDLDALRSRQVTPPGDHLGFIQVRSPKMLVQMIGYLSSVLVFIAFFMRTMIPLHPQVVSRA